MLREGGLDCSRGVSGLGEGGLCFFFSSKDVLIAVLCSFWIFFSGIVSALMYVVFSSLENVRWKIETLAMVAGLLLFKISVSLP